MLKENKQELKTKESKTKMTNLSRKRKKVNNHFLLECTHPTLLDYRSYTDVISGNEEDHDDIIYNPKNLPLGWDGKPIPYWLYKLHGLNIDYKCQICGNQTYRGPKAFQRHFSEWRHAHGMRCLGTYRSHLFFTVSRDVFRNP